MPPVVGVEASLLIHGARNRAGISQTELARRAGMPRSVVNAYERGKREPGTDALARLVAAAGSTLRLGPVSRIDLARNGRILEQVLDLAEQLPTRRRGRLTFPPLRRGTA